jgi:hypothetical protein
VDIAIEKGVTGVEAIAYLACYAGWPRAVSAMAAVKAVLCPPNRRAEPIHPSNSARARAQRPWNGRTGMLTGVLVATVVLASSASVATLAVEGPARASNNGAADSPAQGWSNWRVMQRDPTEAKVEAQAKALSDTGLVSHGYVSPTLTTSGT